MQKSSLHFLRFFLILAWSIIFLHDILPHYHSENGIASIELQDHNKKSEDQHDENGILDNLVFIHNDHSPQLTQFCKAIFEFTAFNSDNNFNLIASCYKISRHLFYLDDPPVKQDYCNLFLLRAPPISA